jgi:hypothetical protein
MWRRRLLLVVAFFTIAGLQFEFYPGHSYLESTSQLYLPILEHLDTPGYLSRDLVATHPNVTYTAYDEITLFLRAAAKLNLRKGLILQQVVCRLAWLLGIFLMARSAQIGTAVSLLIAALVSLGTFLPGPNIWLIDREPVPRAFAFGLIILALGCLSREKPLSAGLFGGIALLYDPVAAGPFWVTVLVIFVFEKRLRTLLRPVLPILLVFILLIANLAQLQPGTPDPQPFVGRISAQIAGIQRFRTPELWVSLWPGKFVYLYVAQFVISIWAVTRISPSLNRQTKWMLLTLAWIGVLSIPLSDLLLEHSLWSGTLRWAPAEWLLYLVTVAFLVCAIAVARSLKLSHNKEALAWSVICCSILALATGAPRRQKPYPTADLAAWAEANTWGSSAFLFADACRANYPGVFRAQSRRALWVDWEGGKQMNYDVALAPEWYERWTSTMERPLSGTDLQTMLSLPIDYYVFAQGHIVRFKTGNLTEPVKPAFVNTRFAVYEASALRLVPGKLIVSYVN